MFGIIELDIIRNKSCIIDTANDITIAIEKLSNAVSKYKNCECEASKLDSSMLIQAACTCPQYDVIVENQRRVSIVERIPGWILGTYKKGVAIYEILEFSPPDVPKVFNLESVTTDLDKCGVFSDLGNSV